jgi:hypothetical protein
MIYLSTLVVRAHWGRLSICLIQAIPPGNPLDL